MLSKIPKERRCASVLTAIVLVLLTSCRTTPQAAVTIEKFAGATTSVMADVKSAFAAVDQAYWELQSSKYRRDIANHNTNNRIPSPPSFHSVFGSDVLSVRLDVIDGLSAYARGLAAIMGSTQLESLDQASKDLGSNLQALVNNNIIKQKFSINVTQQSAAILASAVNAIGHWLVESKRRAAAQEEIQRMQEHVADICNLLQEDLGQPANAQGTGGKGLRGTLHVVYRGQIDNERMWLKNVISSMSPSEKREAADRLSDLSRQYWIADQALVAVGMSLKRLREAHVKLHEAFEKDSQFGIRDAIRQITAEGRRIKGFYESLHNKK